MKGYLTYLKSSLYSEDVQILRASLGLRSDAERGVLVLRAVKPECPANREAWAALNSRNNTRVFYLPGKVQILRRCFMAQEEPADLVNEAMAIVSFLHEAMDALLNYTLKNSDCFSDETPFGLYLCFQSVEDRLKKALDIMTPEGGDK